MPEMFMCIRETYQTGTHIHKVVRDAKEINVKILAQLLFHKEMLSPKICVSSVV